MGIVLVVLAFVVLFAVIWAVRMTEGRRKRSLDAAAQSDPLPAGWWHRSKDPTGVTRFWDGEEWTKLRGRDASHPDRVRVRRLATLAGLVFVGLFLVATFVPLSADGVSCGTWVAPKWTDLTVSMQNLDDVMNGTGNVLSAALLARAQDDCRGKLDVMRSIALGALVVGAVIRWGLPYATRQANDI